MPSKKQTEFALKIGEFIKEQYDKKGLSAYELAKQNKITASGIKLACKGQDLRISTLIIICDMLEVADKDIVDFILKLRK